jgi:DNA-binding CsgD family transcriptional regulator
VQARQEARTHDLLYQRPVQTDGPRPRRLASVSGAAGLATRQGLPVRRGEPSRIDADLVEQTLTACLTLLAQTAAETGQSERALRLRGAVCALRGQAHASGWPSADPRPAPGATSDRRSRTPTSAIPLTDRQREVAALIRQGMTNREIADALVIAERTADTHVENILNKLGLVSRAQIAAWAVEQDVALAQSTAWR